MNGWLQQKLPKFGFRTHTTALAKGAVFHAICQVWLSRGLPELFTFCYCAWLWNWIIVMRYFCTMICYFQTNIHTSLHGQCFPVQICQKITYETAKANSKSYKLSLKFVITPLCAFLISFGLIPMLFELCIQLQYVYTLKCNQTHTKKNPWL